MHYQDIIYQVDDPVAVIKFNRPEALNAFTSRMLAEHTRKSAMVLCASHVADVRNQRHRLWNAQGAE